MKCLIEGCENLSKTRGWCIKHYARWWRNGDPLGGVQHNGCLTKNGYIYRSIDGRRIYEHRRVMEEILGRELIPGETVHHKNGDRADNRPENLELWSTSQPPGQRVEDKLKWARQIIELYGELDVESNE